MPFILEGNLSLTFILNIYVHTFLFSEAHQTEWIKTPPLECLVISIELRVLFV